MKSISLQHSPFIQFCAYIAELKCAVSNIATYRHGNSFVPLRDQTKHLYFIHKDVPKVMIS